MWRNSGVVRRRRGRVVGSPGLGCWLGFRMSCSLVGLFNAQKLWLGSALLIFKWWRATCGRASDLQRVRVLQHLGSKGFGRGSLEWYQHWQWFLVQVHASNCNAWRFSLNRHTLFEGGKRGRHLAASVQTRRMLQPSEMGWSVFHYVCQKASRLWKHILVSWRSSHPVAQYISLPNRCNGSELRHDPRPLIFACDNIEELDASVDRR